MEKKVLSKKKNHFLAHFNTNESADVPVAIVNYHQKRTRLSREKIRN